MRRVLTFAVTVAALASGLVVFMASSAYAETTCGQTDPATGECLVWIEVPGNPGNPSDGDDDGPKDTGSGAACFWDGTKQGINNPRYLLGSPDGRGSGHQARHDLLPLS